MRPGVWNKSKSLFCNNIKRNLISTLFWLDLIVLPFKKYYEPHIFCLQNHVVTLKWAVIGELMKTGMEVNPDKKECVLSTLDTEHN